MTALKYQMHFSDAFFVNLFFELFFFALFQRQQKSLRLVFVTKIQ